MAQVEVICAYCNKPTLKENGHVTRSNKSGNKIYCGRACSGLGRRKNKTKPYLVEQKRIYDSGYREKNLAAIKTKKAIWYKLNRDPGKEKLRRIENRGRHAEYCRQPKYVAYKKLYDQKHRAKKFYGDYWESAILLFSIEKTLKPNKYEIKLSKNLLCKSQKRKRACQTQPISLPRA